jgi:hypothetical protein
MSRVVVRKIPRLNELPGKPGIQTFLTRTLREKGAVRIDLDWLPEPPEAVRMAP